jgi:hypothetical protein
MVVISLEKNQKNFNGENSSLYDDYYKQKNMLQISITLIIKKINQA